MRIRSGWSITVVASMRIEVNGVDYPVTRAWAARAQLDVRLIRSQQDAANGGLRNRDEITRDVVGQGLYQCRRHHRKRNEALRDHRSLSGRGR